MSPSAENLKPETPSETVGFAHTHRGVAPPEPPARGGTGVSKYEKPEIHGFDLKPLASDPEYLATLLYNYLQGRISLGDKTISVPRLWKKFWTEDFQSLLDDGRTRPDIEIVIWASQWPGNQKFYVRAQKIKENFDLLIEKAERRANLFRVHACSYCYCWFSMYSSLAEHLEKCTAAPPPTVLDDAAEEESWYVADDFLNQEGGAFGDPILNLTWPYADPGEPTAAELAKEINGKALATVKDPTDPTKVLVEAGKLVPNFTVLRDDGSTASGCWIYSGCFNENGNNMARRDTTDPDNTGAYLKWAFAWPVNRRTLYNRASADINGKAWDPSRKLIEWDGTKWSGYDVPDIAPTAKPTEVGPFIMNAEGVSRLFTRGLMRDGPFPAHYEPFESPVVNLVSPKVQSNPAARVFKDDWQQFADVESEEFPYAATSYRLTEHFHFWTKHVWVNAVLQPEFFVEISEELAAEKNIKRGGWVRVWSKRGSVRAKAVVTKRIRPLICDGKTVHIIGIPLHWGFTGVAKQGFGPNALTPFVGDANMQTPEFKAFLVNIEPINEPAA